METPITKLKFDKEVLTLFPDLANGSTLPLATMLVSLLKTVSIESLASFTGSLGSKVRNGSMDLVVGVDDDGTESIIGYGQNELFKQVGDGIIQYISGGGRYEYSLTDKVITKAWFENLETDEPAEISIIDKEEGTDSYCIETTTRGLVNDNTALSDYSETIRTIIDAKTGFATDVMYSETDKIKIVTELDDKGMLHKQQLTHFLNDEIEDDENEFVWYTKDDLVGCFTVIGDTHVYIIGNLTYSDLRSITEFSNDLAFAMQCDTVLLAQSAEFPEDKVISPEEALEAAVADALDENYSLDA
jgi:hypothetical protein